MPIFEYRCSSCRKSFERIVLGAAGPAEAIVCPRCGGSGAERLASRFATTAKGGSDAGGNDMDFGGEDFGGGHGGPAGGEEDEFGGADEDTDEALGSEDGEDDD